MPYQKPKFPVPCDAEDPFKAFPKPPTDPLEVKRGLAGARTRLLRAGSLTALPPVEGHTDGKEEKNILMQLWFKEKRWCIKEKRKIVFNV